MLNRHEIEILLKAGHSNTEVARLAGVSLSSMKRIGQEGPVVHIDDAAEREKRRIGRPSQVESFRKLVLDIPAEASRSALSGNSLASARGRFSRWQDSSVRLGRFGSS
jgi:hypothetical protein